MTQQHAPELAVPPALAAEIVAAAEAQHRPPLELPHEAVRDYLARQSPSGAEPRRSLSEAVARMRRARARNPRLTEAALCELMTHARA